MAKVKLSYKKYGGKGGPAKKAKLTKEDEAARAAAVEVAKQKKAKADEAKKKRYEERQAAKKEMVLKQIKALTTDENKLVTKPNLNLFDCSASVPMIHGFLKYHEESMTDELKASWDSLLKKGKKVKASIWRSTFRPFFLETTGLGVAKMDMSEDDDVAKMGKLDKDGNNLVQSDNIGKGKTGGTGESLIEKTGGDKLGETVGKDVKMDKTEMGNTAAETENVDADKSTKMDDTMIDEDTESESSTGTPEFEEEDKKNMPPPLAKKVSYP